MLKVRGGVFAVLCLSVAASIECGGRLRALQAVQGNERTKAAQARMTPMQREHGRIHQSQSHAKGKILDEKALVEVIADYVVLPATRSSQDVLAESLCRVDAVFVGLIDRVTVLPVEDGSMLFSDYAVTVEEVFRTPSNNPVVPGQSTIVTRVGGVTQVDGVSVGTTFNLFPALEPGSRDLFFVRSLPRHESFHADRPDSVFRIERDRVRALVPMPTTDDNTLATGGVESARVRGWLEETRCR